MHLECVQAADEDKAAQEVQSRFVFNVQAVVSELNNQCIKALKQSRRRGVNPPEVLHR